MKGYVYSIRSHLKPELVYYGSTKETLARRLAGHRKSYKRYLAGKTHFVSSFKLLEAGEAYIELVQIVEYTEKAELHAAEGKWIRENICVNKHVPGRSDAKYYRDNATAIFARHVEYEAANAAHIKEKHDCQCGGKYTTQGIARHTRTLKHTAWLANQTT